MIRIHRVLLAFLVVASPVTFASLPEDSAVLGAFIDGVVEPLMLTNNSPSGTVAIVKDGELIFARGYGFADIDQQVPVDPAQTLFRPGSVSKLFTWVAVMQLVEAGELDLDEDVNSYLQTFEIADTFDEPVTLRHIMTHTAGFEDGGFGYLIIEDPEQAIPLREAMRRYQPARVNPPGVQTAYSNYATSLAGLIVENVSEIPFNRYVQEHIFDPLGMASSSFEEPLPSPLDARMAGSYGPESGAFKEQPFEIISNFGPAGALSSTATDMLRFAQAILNGGELDGNRILESETLDQMLTVSFTHDARLTGMLLGFYESNHSGNRVVGHGGDTQWFHSDLGIDLENNLAFFVSFGGPGGRVPRSALPTALYEQFYQRGETTVPEPPEGFLDRAAKYAGTYRFWRGNFSTIERAFGITSVVAIAPTADDTLVLGFANSTKQYVEVDDNLFRERDPNLSLIAGISPREIAFQENDEGAITGFVMDGLPFMSLYKASVVSTPSFNFTVLGLCLLVFIGVVLRRIYQRKPIASLDRADRSAISAAVYASVAHLLVAVVGVTVMAIAMDNLIAGLPLSFKLWLVLPILAVLASLYLLFRTVVVWQQGLLASVWWRIRYSIVTACAFLMCWFYWYWNILGFQYL
jgi:CubicO group peptidase (beta-lactamase class C family)